jgi:hypothetical protein
MIVICNLIIDYTRISIDLVLEPVVSLYNEGKAYYFSERAIWLFAEILKEKLLYKEAANLMISLAADVLIFIS